MESSAVCRLDVAMDGPFRRLCTVVRQRRTDAGLRGLAIQLWTWRPLNAVAEDIHSLETANLWSSSRRIEQKYHSSGAALRLLKSRCFVRLAIISNRYTEIWPRRLKVVLEGRRGLSSRSRLNVLCHACGLFRRIGVRLDRLDDGPTFQRTRAPNCDDRIDAEEHCRDLIDASTEPGIRRLDAWPQISEPLKNCSRSRAVAQRGLHRCFHPHPINCRPSHRRSPSHHCAKGDRANLAFVCRQVHLNRYPAFKSCSTDQGYKQSFAVGTAWHDGFLLQPSTHHFHHFDDRPVDGCRE